MNDDKILLELKYIKDQIDDLLGMLRGDESDATKPGLNVRVDRLEQSKKAHNWLLGAIFTAGITVLTGVAITAMVRYI
jgi:hypothetical protein